MSTHTTPTRESLQAAARTVITSLAGAAVPQHLLQHSRPLHTAVKEREAMLTDTHAAPARPAPPDCRTA
ncbi:hypothetical protein ACFY6U_02490 [Streptomyces sp. NPDC013157]|uniref:hypothetical protein n=1 Tax=Streptomyces sp. NPDC013157 TaxID=3364861 RepID=UPI0036A66187